MAAIRSKADKLGPGSCKFGATGSEKEIAYQCSEIKLSPETKVDDAVKYLSGTETVGEIERSYKLSGKLAQEYSRDSLIKWCKDNDGEVVPFVFKPSNNGELIAKGAVLVTAIEFGGEVMKTNTSDFEFTGVGEWIIEVDPVVGA